MAMPLSWKVGAVAAGAIIVALAWGGLSRYLAARQADETLRDAARAAELDSQQAKANAAQYHEQLAASLKQQQENMSNLHQEVIEQARQYQAQRTARLDKEHEEELRIQAGYQLSRNERCAGGIVIAHDGPKFTQVVGKDGQPIACQGNVAAEPLR